ncbi:MAG: methyltransferase [Saprospiraceae bacterium]|jgi:tRNA1Val (adenine37-N6)-methyltransferase|nr:methyltransferase [Saprospiraceae bacterium]
MQRSKNDPDGFRFKQFEIRQDRCTMKVNTDGVLLGAWTDLSNKKKSLDIGTGTGLIAIMIAQKSLKIISHGIEIDENASIQAKINMENSPFHARLTSIYQSVQDYMSSTSEKYDLIVSNPPFFSGGTFSLNENKANVRHTIKLSHVDLLNTVRNLLSHDGHFDVILPYIEGLRFIELATKYDFGVVKLTEVMPREDKGIERLLIRFAMKYNHVYKSETLIIHNSTQPNDYTPEFQNLTKEFYLFMA